tara:strand:- start:339 stop:557 length:219 start_codon:yes stop_codon:yes gene_type:complete
MALKRNTKVWILDYPFGKPLKTRGKIVGRIGEDHYNVIIESGLMEGSIVKYKYWKLQQIQEEPAQVTKKREK